MFCIIYLYRKKFGLILLFTNTIERNWSVNAVSPMNSSASLSKMDAINKRILPSSKPASSALPFSSVWKKKFTH